MQLSREMLDILDPALRAGLRIDLSRQDGKLYVAVHGFNSVNNPGDWVRRFQRTFGVAKLRHNAMDSTNWWYGASEQIDLTLFSYLGPRCRIEEYTVTEPAKPQRTLSAEPEQQVTRTRIVCDKPVLEA